MKSSPNGVKKRLCSDPATIVTAASPMIAVHYYGTRILYQSALTI